VAAPSASRPPSRPLSLIFAVAENGAFGMAGGLPWNYPEDRAHFARTTRGHAVIMGRRTWDERGTPLPDRVNVVVSRAMTPPPDVLVAPDLDRALSYAYARDPEPFLIGGARLFDEALPRATRVYVTWIPGRPQADTFFDFDPRPFRVAREWNGAAGLRFQVLDR
jgi:dihydrofolate reductase